jgi:glycosyltransferase involved in cell wall biosynthesis
MRILVCAGSFPPKVGGLEVLLAHLVPAFRERGHDATVVTFRRSDDEPVLDELEGITVHRLELRLRPGLSAPMAHIMLEREFVRIAHSFSPDVVHAHDAWLFGGMHLRSSAGATVPLVLTAHTARPRPLDGGAAKAARHVLHAATWTTAVSESLLNDLCLLEPSIEDRSSVLHSGVPWPSDSDQRLPLPDHPTLLCIGRLSPEKGFDAAIRALAAFPETDMPARLKIVGEGPERGALETLATELEVGTRVEFLGARDRQELPGLFAAATVVAMPSRREALPLVAMEAAMAGRPVVATAVGGLPEIVADGETGLLVRPGDSRQLTSTLFDLLYDSERCVELSTAAHLLASTNFTFERCVDAYEAILERVVDSQSTIVSPL